MPKRIVRAVCILLLVTAEPLDFIERWVGKVAVVISFLVFAGLLLAGASIGLVIPIPAKAVVFKTAGGETLTRLVEGPRWPFILGLPSLTALVFVFVAAVRLHLRAEAQIRARGDELSALKTPRLCVDLAESVVENGLRNHRFRVSNPTGLPIAGCYGKYRNYRIVQAGAGQVNQIPHDLMPLRWDFRTHQSRPEADIGPHSAGLLSYGVQVYPLAGGPYFEHVAGPDAHGRANTTSHRLFPGIYEFELEVGSNAASFPPIRRTVHLDFRDNDHFEITLQ
ncbi:MAG: hypothetical protein HY678_05675 [Chloroflexi bacterium]|nr:hypothetical protein [Chloroflexota bacterium]